MATRRPCTASPCVKGAARARIVWTAVLLLVLVTPFAGFIAPASVEAHHTNIKFPFASGSTWRVLQGYNGSSHQNNSSTWQYYYSLDLVRADGNTAGQRVISPVDGTIRWIDESTGGMSINLGDGYAFAYFHTRLASGLEAGQAIAQGQYLGTVAPSGEASNGGTPHIHVTLWSTNDGGNWDRHAIPFTGDHKIDGYDFPDIGGSNQHLNTNVVSTNRELQGSGSGTPPAVPTLSSPATGTTYRTSPTTTTLRWSAVSGATDYQVVINDGNITSPWVTSTSWTTGSYGNGQYTWQVRSRNAAGQSNLTAKWVFWIDGSSGTTPTSTPTKTATPSGTPSGTATPVPLKMTLGTTSGRVGTSVTANGTGYGKSETIRFYIDSVTSANQIGQTAANASGAWSTTLTIPDAIGGNHSIIGRGMTTDKRVPITFKVTSYLNRTPYQGPVGTTINLTVQGYGANETVKTTFDATTGELLANVTTNAKGTGSASFKLPEASTGWHDYVGVGQTSKLSAWGALYIEPTFSLSANKGAPATQLTATIKGFASSQAITVAWNKVAGSNGTSVCSGTTSNKGSFNCSFAIPNVVAGSYPVVAATSGGSSTVNVTVTGTPAVTVSPKSGPVGDNLSVSLGGFNANETVNFTWDSSTTVWQSGKADANGALNFPALVPNLSKAAHTLRAKGVTSGKTATTTFTIVAGSPANTSMIGPGTFAVTATEEDLIGETTSNGHKIVPMDRFVALPACTESSCPWLEPGGDEYVAACGDNCYVRVTNPANDKCSVAPVWDHGPWFTNDNWWDPTNERVLNNLPTTKNILPQGYTGADAAKDGLDVGYGLSNGIGISNVGYQVGNRAVIDLGDGTWTDIGFADGQGIGQVVVTILWLSGEDHAAAARTCGTPAGAGTKTPTPTATPSTSRSVRPSPSSGLVGATIKLTGTGFGGNEKVDIYFDSMSTTALKTLTANSSGVISGSIVIPETKAGAHKIYGRGQTVAKSDSAAFTVLPAVYRPSGTSTSGSSIPVSVKGYGASESVQIRWNSSTSSVMTTLKTNAKGTASGTLTIPSSVQTGTYQLYGTGATTGVQASKAISVTNPTAVAVTLSTSKGSPRSAVTATGVNFRSGEVVDFFWDSSTASVGSGTANSSGRVTVSADIPLLPVGAHTVKLKGRSSGKSATATYTIVQAVEVTPASGASGTTVTVKGRGWKANTAVSVYWNRSATKSGTRVCNVTASSTGTFTCTFKAPSGSAATYPVVGVSGSLTASGTFRITGVQAASVSERVTTAEEASTPSATPTVSVTVDPSASPTEAATTTPTPVATVAGTETPETSETPIPTETAAATETPTVEPTATETTEPTATPEPTERPERDRRLGLSPTRGESGTEVSISGSGFDAGELVDVFFESTDSAPVLTVEANGDGEITGAVVIPDVEAGNLLIAAKGQTSGAKASKSFRVLRTRESRQNDEEATEPSTSDGAAAEGDGDVAEEPAAEPTLEPTSEPEPYDVVFVPVADTSVAPTGEGTPEAQADVTGLAAGGASGAVAFITFQVEGIAAGSVISAHLVLTTTGDASGATGTIGALPEVWTDESSWTYESAPISGAGPAITADGSAASAWLDPWVETVVDVTGTVAADGTITFVIPGTPDATILLGSRESGNPARLVVTAIDTPTEG